MLAFRPPGTVPSLVVAAVTPEQLESTREVRVRRESQIRRRRSVVGATLALATVALVAGVLAQVRRTSGADEAAVASPVVASALDLGTRPPDRVIARVGAVEVHLPIDRQRIALTLFRSVDNPSAVAFTPDGTWKHTIASSSGKAGPKTAGLDIAAPPGAIIYAPVNGTITGVTDYVVKGKKAGYQVDISPETRSDIVVRVRHIEVIPVDRRATDVCDDSPWFERPSVGQFVTAGVTCIGQIRDASSLSDVARPEVARYVSGPGNHVHMEVVRVGS